MKIIGAGIAGLLAANMLRHHGVKVIEKQVALPNNHSAVLRFRSHVIGDVTGIEFKKVQVIKATLPWRNAVADALAYSDKNTSTMLSNRSIPAGVSTVERYIAPPDLINQLAHNVDISYGANVECSWFKWDNNEPIISTVPMPVLMDILGYKGIAPDFQSIGGINISARVKRCDAYVSLYVPSPAFAFSRVSLMGDELIAEVPYPYGAVQDHELIYVAAGLLGIDRERLFDLKATSQLYAKIQEIDEGLRKRFITWASDTMGIFSLGRYACWRPGLLLDDLVQDIRLIERWIKDGKYGRKIHQTY